jgi:hypothetical protein
VRPTIRFADAVGETARQSGEPPLPFKFYI